MYFCGLPSCTSASRRLNALRQIKSGVEKLSERSWLASFEGQARFCNPVEGYTVFANESGDAIALMAGSCARSWGLAEQAITISDDGWVRSSQSGKERFATCSEWQKDAATKGYQWRQICGINGHETVISIDETGSISE